MMDRRNWLISSVLLLAGRRGWSQDAPDLREVVSRGIAAAGGQELITRMRAQTWKSIQKYHQPEGTSEIEVSYACQWPDKFRSEFPGGTILVRNGETAWLKQEGEVRELEGDQLAFLKEDLYINWVRTLVPLTAKEFQLKPVPQIMVDGKPTVGVRVASKGHHDIALLFDKDTLQLVKSESRSRGLSQTGKLAHIETFHTEYVDVAGMKVATRARVLRDGELLMEIETRDIERTESLDEKLFARPE